MGEEIIGNIEHICTKTHLDALFIEALYDLPFVLGDDARFLHVAKCGESLLYLHEEDSSTF